MKEVLISLLAKPRILGFKRLTHCRCLSAALGSLTSTYASMWTMCCPNGMMIAP